jgi:hypothetical protein
MIRANFARRRRRCIYFCGLFRSMYREGAGHGDHGAAAAGVAPAAGNGMTELQKHVAFFDRNHDGVITFDETYQGEPGV